MAIVLALTGMAILVVALVLFVRSSREATATGATSNRRGIILLVFLGLALALASQLPVFHG